MWWFNRRRRLELWDEDIQWPIGDIEAAQRIRNICRTAADSAEKIAGFADRTSRKSKREVDRYERAARRAMEIAMKISDELMRDASVRQIVDLCMSANDTKTARTLLRAIQAPSILRDVLNDHPVLLQAADDDKPSV